MFELQEILRMEKEGVVREVSHEPHIINPLSVVDSNKRR